MGRVCRGLITYLLRSAIGLRVARDTASVMDAFNKLESIAEETVGPRAPGPVPAPLPLPLYVLVQDLLPPLVHHL